MKEWFKIRNDVWEACMFRFKIPAADRRTLGLLIRWTYGFRGRDRMSVDRERFAKDLGSSVRLVEKALVSLVEHGAVKQFESGVKGSASVYGPNANLSDWTYPKYTDQTDRGISRNTPIETIGEFDPKRSGNLTRNDRGISRANPGGSADRSPPKYNMKENMKDNMGEGGENSSLLGVLERAVSRHLVGRDLKPDEAELLSSFVSDFSENGRTAYEAFRLALRSMKQTQDQRLATGQQPIFKPVGLVVENARIIFATLPKRKENRRQ